MEVGAVAETVNVTAAPQIIDTTSTTAGVVISSDLLENIPVGRRLADTLYLAPGTSSSSTAGHINPSMSGGSGLDNLYVIDGINVTSTGYGGLGSYSTTFGSPGTRRPSTSSRKSKIKTAGYDAEFGQSTGGVVNVVTRSGSNELRGSVFGKAGPLPLSTTCRKSKARRRRGLEIREFGFHAVRIKKTAINHEATSFHPAGKALGCSNAAPMFW
jgi:hypothetical protein